VNEKIIMDEKLWSRSENKSRKKMNKTEARWNQAKPTSTLAL
jgi:hypothetical protein